MFFRYHTGSIAFGALLIAIIQLIRIILEYIDHKLKGKDNKVVKFILCCCKCCFWCLEKFMKFINRNAYIMVTLSNWKKIVFFCFPKLIRDFLAVNRLRFTERIFVGPPKKRSSCCCAIFLELQCWTKLRTSLSLWVSGSRQLVSLFN